MAKAKAEKLVERLVVGPKGIHGIDPKTGDRRHYAVGETIKLPAKSAKKFARYLEAPGVAKAKAAAKAAEEEAEADEGDAAEGTKAAAAPEGGDSSES